MDLGAGGGGQISALVGTQGNMGGRSHWPGMWRVPAWGELENREGWMSMALTFFYFIFFPYFNNSKRPNCTCDHKRKLFQSLDGGLK